MLEKLNKIMDELNHIEYGFKDSNNYNMIDNMDTWQDNFNKHYHLLSPEELLQKKCGVCWDQVELERYLLNKENIDCDSYLISKGNNDSFQTHTFVVAKDLNKYYWLEHSWEKYKGIYEYNSINELLQDVKVKFLDNGNNDINIYKYNKPSYNINSKQFLKYIETQDLIKID